MAKKPSYGIITTYFHIFPAVKLLGTTETIGKVVLKSKECLPNEQLRVREFLGYAFSLFKDPSGNCLTYGAYVLDEGHSVVEDIWSLVRFAAYVPSEEGEFYQPRRSPDLADWFAFYTPQHEDEENKEFEIHSVAKNGVESRDVFWGTDFFPFAQRLHKSDVCLFLPREELNVSKRLADLFSQDSEYDIETIKLAGRLRKAIHWYNKSFEQSLLEHSLAKAHFWNLESQILYMAIAFETLFQPSKADIQKHLGTSLKVIFPDNEFVPKWLNQFYAARSTIAHGSSPGKKELEFMPDKGEHRSLIYWARRIFRACVEATVSQWETARKRGLLKLMTPNRIRLNRILGKLRDTPGEELLQSIPDDIRTDIRDLHASFIDIPDESYLEQTAHISRVLSSIAVKSPSLEGSELHAPFSELLSLPQDWYKQMELRDKARSIYSTILTWTSQNQKGFDLR